MQWQQGLRFRIGRSWRAVIAFLLLACGVPPSPTFLHGEDQVRQDTAPSEHRIEELIELLGADEFATRERAQTELSRLGPVAFDALFRAQSHEDIEVAFRARYLVRRLRVRWIEENDPAEVKRILRNYHDQNEKDRVSLMQRLAALDDWQGTEALCRLVRFENFSVLSKRAALLVMKQPRPGDVDGRVVLRDRIEQCIGTSRRPAAQWLRAYARFLVTPEATVSLWDQLTVAEQETLQQGSEKTTEDIVREFLRWQADMLSQLGHKADSLAVVQRIIELGNGSVEEILELVDWLLQRSLWEVVEGVAKKYQDEFDKDSRLLYALAESQLKRGQEKTAQQTADQAIATNADSPAQHLVAAYTLQDRGLFQWSEREYQRAIEVAPDASDIGLNARLMFSEMLHDQQRESAAAEVLQVAVDLMEKDAAVAKNMATLGRDPESIRSRMHFFYAQHYAEQRDREKQREHLEKGIQSDPTDADVLIAMFRIGDADQAWRERTDKGIETAADKFRMEIGLLRRRVQTEENEALREYFRRRLASSYNQLAWLIGNTRGDFHEALRCSQKSLEIRPDEAGYLDTLGRCYYALGDYENAVKHQALAVELEPNSGQILRQLILFKEARDAVRGTGTGGDS